MGTARAPIAARAASWQRRAKVRGSAPLGDSDLLSRSSSSPSGGGSDQIVARCLDAPAGEISARGGSDARSGLPRRRLRRCRDGVHRRASRRVTRGRRRHGRPAAGARRALARSVSVRASPPAVGVLRRQLAAARQRDDRHPRTEPGHVRARGRRRDLPLLRPRHAEARLAVGARPLVPHVTLDR